MLTTDVTTETFQRPVDFDVAAYLRQSIAETVYGTRCEVVLALTLAAAQSRVSPTAGTLEEAEEGTVLREVAATWP